MTPNATPVIRTPDQRLRVFVSSTLGELAAERAAAAEAIRSLKLTPVLFELGARPHPPRSLYRAYLEQSHVFVGIYGERYGWIAPGMATSGLEDEYLLSGERPKLLYVKAAAPDRDARLRAFLERVERHDRACYKTFASADELRAMLADDLAVLLSERFEGAAAAPVPSGTHRRAAGLRRAAAGALAVAAVLLVSAALWLSRRTAEVPGKPAAVPAVAEFASIAVLPLVNMSPDRSRDYFADGLSEELLNVLAKVPQLRVISRTSSFQFKDRSEDVRTIAQKLNVAHVLEGSVRESGGLMRITAQLVSGVDGSHEWSETYDRPLGDIFGVQDEIARRVVQELRLMLVVDQRPGRMSPRAAEAYSLVLQARYQLNLRTRESTDRAVELLTRALALDDRYAFAWAVLARAYATQAGSAFAPLDESVARAREAADRALALDPKLADALLIMGWIHVSYDWDWAAADTAYTRALALEPGRAAVLAGAALLARALGRFDESVELCRRAVARDPLQGLAHTSLAISLMYAGRLDEAEAAARRAIELRPDAIGQAHLLARVLLAKGQPELARIENEKEPDEGWRLMGRALVSHALGRAADSDAALDELTRKFAADMPFQIAEVHAYRGELDRALAWLERARGAHDTGFAELKGDPLLRKLEGDPRYVAFVRALGLPA